MDPKGLKIKIEYIVEKATGLKNKRTDEKDAPVNYACIFSQSKKEYDELVEVTRKIGRVVKTTPTGLVFQIQPLKTISGVLKLLKIRMPDPKRPEIGYADFTVSDYTKFKENYLTKDGFQLVKRPDFEMIELVDPKFYVRVYFSNPTMEKVLGIK